MREYLPWQAVEFRALYGRTSELCAELSKAVTVPDAWQTQRAAGP
jgi:hypothetical protein